jgi:hypothetical protein
VIELVVTAPRGESWRCQAIQSDGRRCIRPAVWFGHHDVHRIPINLCSGCKAIVDAGAVVRINASAGVETKSVVAYGGPFDMDPFEVPADLHVGDTWAVQLEGENGKLGTTHLYRLDGNGLLQHEGVREDPPPTATTPEMQT